VGQLDGGMHATGMVAGLARRLRAVTPGPVPTSPSASTAQIVRHAGEVCQLAAKAAVQAYHARIRSAIVSPWARRLDPRMPNVQGKSWDLGGA